MFTSCPFVADCALFYPLPCQDFRRTFRLILDCTETPPLAPKPPDGRDRPTGRDLIPREEEPISLLSFSHWFS